MAQGEGGGTNRAEQENILPSHDSWSRVLARLDQGVNEIPHHTGIAALLEDVSSSIARDYFERLDGVVRGINSDNVHRLRTTSRRFLVVLDALEYVNGGKSIRRIRKQVREHLRSLNNLRDVDIFSAHLHDLAGKEFEGGRFCASLDDRRESLVKEAQEAFSKIKVEAFRDECHAALQDARTKIENRHPDGIALGEGLAEWFGAQLATLREKMSRLDPSKPKTFHRMRIAGKRLRYGLEAFKALIPGLDKSHEEDIVNVHRFLGEIQDRNVLLDLIDELECGREQAVEKKLILARLNEEQAHGIRLAYECLLPQIERSQGGVH